MVYIIVLHWQDASNTINCAESILAQTGCRYQLVICDNGSATDSLQAIINWASNLPFCDTTDNYTGTGIGNNIDVNADTENRLIERSNEPSSWTEECHPAGSIVLIRTGSNLGYAGGNNVGIRYAMRQVDTEYIWMLNNDTEVAPGALSALLRKAKQNPEYGIIGSTLLYFYRPQHVQVLAGCRFSTWTTKIEPLGEGQLATVAANADEAAVETKLDYVTGAAMLVSKAFIQDVGLMAEDYFLYCEEIDWAERGRRSTKTNWQLGFARDSVVLHKVGASAETGVSAAATKYFYTSKLRFMNRFYPSRYRWVVFMVFLQGLKKLIGGELAQARIIIEVIRNFDTRAATRSN